MAFPPGRRGPTFPPHGARLVASHRQRSGPFDLREAAAGHSQVADTPPGIDDADTHWRSHRDHPRHLPHNRFPCLPTNISSYSMDRICKEGTTYRSGGWFAGIEETYIPQNRQYRD